MLETTTLGPLGVSEIALGAMFFGTLTDEDTSRRLLERFVEAGGNFIDTSNNYAFWPEGGTGRESETLLGRWLKARGRRDDVVIATKVGAQPNRPGAGLEDVQGLSKAVILANIDQSLARLGTDHVDLYYAHVDDRRVPIEETLEAFGEVVRAGKARAVGCSNYTAWRIAEARAASAAGGLPDYVAVQHRHSYFQPRRRADFGIQSRLGLVGFGIEHSLGDEHLDYARAHPEFRIVAYSPLLSGGYARREKLRDLYVTEANEGRRAVLEAVAAETGATANQVVLAWMMRSDPPVIPLIAASGLGQLEENLGAVRVRLDADQLARLEAAA